MFGMGGPPGAFGFLFSSVVGIALVAGWVILAGSRFVQGGVMERPERVPQLYGYTACLIGLIWAMTSLASVVENTLTLNQPLSATNEFAAFSQPSVTSFEAFRATYDRARRFAMPGETPAPRSDSIPEVELRRRYEALRTDSIQQATDRARRGLVTGTFGLILGAGLALFHWRWLRRRGIDLESVRHAGDRATTTS